MCVTAITLNGFMNISNGYIGNVLFIQLQNNLYLKTLKLNMSFTYSSSTSNASIDMDKLIWCEIVKEKKGK